MSATLGDLAAFADSGVTGIGDLALAIGVSDKPTGKQALHDLGAGATTQRRW
jgi:hypothetical protein